MVEAGENSVTVTRTTATPEQQAAVMYNNLEADGTTEPSCNLYGSGGDQVIDTYVEASGGEGATPATIKNAMIDKINEVEPQNVTRHTADPTKLNVIDIAPSSVTNDKSFHKSIKRNSGISNSFTPYDKKVDKAFHVEIPQ